MKFHNQDIKSQYNTIMGALELARSEMEVTVGEHRKSDYDSQEDYDSVEEGLQADVDYINSAIEIVKMWAINLDSSIPSSSF